MLDFIALQYVLGLIDANKVQSYAPKFITQDQADIITTAQQSK